MLLDEKVIEIGRALTAARVPHAFGGAIALAYYATPRGTHDIDVNVFVPASRATGVLELLAGLGAESVNAEQLSRLEQQGQLRIRWGHTPLDLFFSYDPFHDECLRNKRHVPFGSDAEIDVLGPEDLLVFKVLFDRPKDWSDVAEMIYALGAQLDVGYASDWLRRILAPDDPRLARFVELLRSPLAPEAP